MTERQQTKQLVLDVRDWLAQRLNADVELLWHAGGSNCTNCIAAVCAVLGARAKQLIHEQPGRDAEVRELIGLLVSDLYGDHVGQSVSGGPPAAPTNTITH